MNRTLIAVAVGLILGAILFGMFQRDQDADAGTDIAHPHAAVSGAIQHPGDPNASNRDRTRWGDYQGTGVRAPEMPTVDNSQRIASRSPEAQRERISVAQQWQDRRAARQRELAERRKQLAEQQRAQMSSIQTTGGSSRNGDIASQINALAGAQQGAARERFVEMLTPEGESAEVAAAREAFQDQLSEFKGRDPDGQSRDGSGGSLPGQEGPAGPLEALAALAGADPGGAGANGALAAILRALGSTLSINSNFLNSLPPGFGNIPGLPPIPGLPGGPEEDPLVVVAEWFPVEARGCTGLPYSRINDLYLRVNRPFKVLNIASNSRNGLRVVNGEFLQNPLSGNVTPGDPNSCVAIDSFLAMGFAIPTTTSQNPFSDIGSDQVVNANWLAFAEDGSPGILPTRSQPGNRLRIWAGRFAVAGNPESVSGKLTVFFLDPNAIFPFPKIVDVEIPHAPELWQLGGPPPPPGVAFFDIAQSQVTAGLPILVDINLKKPAPFGGAVVELKSSHPNIIRIPASVTIPVGASSVELAMRTRDVEATTRVRLTAQTGANLSVFDDVDVKPRPKGDVDSSGVVDGADLASMLAAWESNNPFVDFNNDGTVNGADLAALLASWTPPAGVRLIRIAPDEVKPGNEFQVTIQLDRPAPESGVEVKLQSSHPDIVKPPPVLTIPYRGVEATVPLTPSVVNTDTSVSISAEANGVIQAASILVRSTIGDVDGDGSVDGADLASLLASWGNENVEPSVDFDGDGEVDGADLAALLSHWTGTVLVPPGEGPVNAKWIPISIGEDCAEDLVGVRTADLYLGFEESLLAPVATVIQSAPETGLHLNVGGGFHQDPDIDEDGPPSFGALTLFPCSEFDSYVTLGESSPFFTPEYSPPFFTIREDPEDPDKDPIPVLVAEWLSGDFSGASIEFESDFEKFGDSRLYIRIARISVTDGTTFVGGDLLVRYAPVSGGGSIVAETVVIENCPSCWADLDLNQDGIVDDADIDTLAAFMGSDATVADFDSSGVVDGLDLRILLDAISGSD